ncbi:MAG TPA: hypothetical protein VFA38_07390, partial [Nitrospirales bacterium]|nr:hypothetical protein [Nitrospirales bacterium]
MDETLKAAAVLNPPVGGRLSFGVRIARPTAASLAQWLPDVLMGAALGVFSAILAWQAGMSLDPMVLQTWDIWFEGDIGRIYENLTDRWSDHF